MLGRINWANDPDAARPNVLEDLVPGGKRFRPAGSLPLQQLFGLINWSNSAEPSAWPILSDETVPEAKPANVAAVLSEFSWGD